jgi:hypothetical protein
MSPLIVDIGRALVGNHFSYSWVHVSHILAKLLPVLQSIWQSTVLCFWKKGNHNSSKQWTAAEDKRRPEWSKCFLKEKRLSSKYSLTCQWILNMWRQKLLQIALKLNHTTEHSVSLRQSVHLNRHFTLNSLATLMTRIRFVCEACTNIWLNNIICG